MLDAPKPHFSRYVMARPRSSHALLVVAWLCAPLSGCHSNTGGGASDPIAAQSQAAQRSFRPLEERFWLTPRRNLDSLRPELTTFERTFGSDPLATRARILLALQAAWFGRQTECRGWLDRAGPLPEGPTQDLATIAAALAAERGGDAARAWELLAPGRGKWVEPEARFWGHEVAARAAFALGRTRDGYYELAAAVAAADGITRPRAERHARTQLDQLNDARLSALLAESPDATPAPSAEQAATRLWLHREAANLLGKRALAAHDSNLAALVVQRSAGGGTTLPERRDLSALAREQDVKAQVQGRTLGFVLSQGSESGRQRALAALQGMLSSLTLGGAATESEEIQLVTEPLDGETPDAMTKALERLQSQGAVLLVAAVDEQEATAAAASSARLEVPILLLHPPQGSLERAFLLGETGSFGETELRAALETAAGGPMGSPSPCDESPAGLRTWWKSSPLILHEPRVCPSDGWLQVPPAPERVSALVGLGLFATELAPHLRADVWMTGAGQFPTRTGPAWGMNWFAALGHDAALLGTATLAPLPASRLLDDAAVAEYQREVRRNLSRAETDLWTTQARGFAGKQRLERTPVTLRWTSP